MIRYYFILFLFLLPFATRAEDPEHLILKRNLQPDWMTYSKEGYRPFTKSTEGVTTIYFSLPSNNDPNDYLILRSDYRFSVWLNSALLFENTKELKLPIDSLRESHPDGVLAFAVHQENEIDDTLRTEIFSKISDAVAPAESWSLKKGSAFSDFMITAVLILLIFLVAVIRLNPRLSSEFFSVAKIFSLRESEDDVFYYRLTSTNILFYLFASMTLAVYLMVIGQFIGIKIGTFIFQATGYAPLLFSWLQLSLVILFSLFLKMVIVYSISTLFGIRDMAGFHFFNFIRLILVIVGLLTLILTFYYILHGQSKVFYGLLQSSLTWVLGGWIVLLFLKLINRVTYSVFHLFSYICATEIIPFLLIVKVLNE